MQHVHQAEGLGPLTAVRRRRARAAALAALLAGSVAGPFGAPVAGTSEPDPGGEPVAVVADDGSVAPARVSPAELAALQAEPGAVVTRGRVANPELAQSVPKVGAPAYWGLGHRGAGRVIAVIDTGVGTTFGGTLVGQACFAASQVGPNLDGHCGPSRDVTEAFDSTCFDLGVCGVGDVLDTAAARPCDQPTVPKDCAHGTAVAAVAARHEPTPGVAPDAGVYAVQVFNPTGRSADFVDILLAVDHVADMAEAGMDVAVVNLSLSSAAVYPKACDVGASPDSDAVAFRAAFARLDALGIPSTVATGNDAATGSIGLPSCVSNAVAVGASDLDDDIADFGNRGPLTDLVAPGADEGNGTVDRMEIPGSPVLEWAGTSFAAPHVAGAFTLLQQEYGPAAPWQLLDHMKRTGAVATDPETGSTYKRLRLQTPAQALPAGLLFPSAANAAGTSRAGVGDFDGDGRGDVLAYGPGSAGDRIAFGTDRWNLQTRSYSVAGSYTPIVGQFRGTPADDILWYAPGGSADWLWVGAANRTFATAPLTVNGTYQPLVGDYDGDGYDDILWYAPGSAADSLWYGGAAGFTPRSAAISGTYRTAVGDVDGDSRDDVVFHGPGTAADFLWRGTATRGTWASSSLTIGGTNTLRTGDLNGDGADDLLLYQAGSGADAIWRGGPAVGGGGPTGGFSPLAVSVNGTYAPSVGDVDGDGRDDILWYAPGVTSEFLWLGRASGPPASRGFSVVGTYTPLLVDLDADGGTDITWFQSAGVATPVYWSH